MPQPSMGGRGVAVAVALFAAGLLAAGCSDNSPGAQDPAEGETGGPAPGGQRQAAGPPSTDGRLCAGDLCIEPAHAIVPGAHAASVPVFRFPLSINFAFWQHAAGEGRYAWEVRDWQTERISTIALMDLDTGSVSFDPHAPGFWLRNPVILPDGVVFEVQFRDGSNELQKWDLAAGTTAPFDTGVEGGALLDARGGWMRVYSEVEPGLWAVRLSDGIAFDQDLDPGEAGIVDAPSGGSVEWWSKLDEDGNLYWSDPASRDGRNFTRILTRALPAGNVATAFESDLRFNDFLPLRDGFLLQSGHTTWLVKDGLPTQLQVSAETFFGISVNHAGFVVGAGYSGSAEVLLLIAPDGTATTLFEAAGSVLGRYELLDDEVIFWAASGSWPAEPFPTIEWTMHRFALPAA